MQEYTNDHLFNVSIFHIADLLCRILPIAFFQYPLCTTIERIQSFKLYRWIISWWFWDCIISCNLVRPVAKAYFFFWALGFKLCSEKLFRDSAFAAEMVCNPKEKDLFRVNYEIWFCPTILRQVPSVAKETTAGDIYIYIYFLLETYNRVVFPSHKSIHMV